MESKGGNPPKDPPAENDPEEHTSEEEHGGEGEEQTTDSDPEEDTDNDGEEGEDHHSRGELKSMSKEDARNLAEGFLGHFTPMLEQIAGKLEELEYVSKKAGMDSWLFIL